MKEIKLKDKHAREEVLGHIGKGAILLQLPSVYALVALPTKEGVRQLNEAKSRLPNKNYGSLIGDMECFFKLFEPSTLPEGYQDLAAFLPFTQVFIRAQVAGGEFNSSVVRHGTHQGLVLPGPIQDLCQEIETHFASHADPDLFAGKTYTSPLCSSANISGDPSGSITELERARAFGRARGIRLLVRLDNAEVASDSGSYPIFHFQKSGVSVARNGPGMERFQHLLMDKIS